MIDNKVSTEFVEKRVVVTGGTGMIGRQVVEKLCNMGADVICVSLDEIKTDDRAEKVFADLTNLSICHEIGRAHV